MAKSGMQSVLWVHGRVQCHGACTSLPRNGWHPSAYLACSRSVLRLDATTLILGLWPVLGAVVGLARPAHRPCGWATLLFWDRKEWRPTCIACGPPTQIGVWLTRLGTFLFDWIHRAGWVGMVLDQPRPPVLGACTRPFTRVVPPFVPAFSMIFGAWIESSLWPPSLCHAGRT